MSKMKKALRLWLMIEYKYSTRVPGRAPVVRLVDNVKLLAHMIRVKILTARGYYGIGGSIDPGPEKFRVPVLYLRF